MVITIKIFFFRNLSPMILKLGMQRRGFKFQKNYMNDDHGLTLTYFVARSNLVAYTFEWGTTSFKQLTADGQSDRRFMFLNKYLTPWDCLVYLHLHDHYFQTSSSLKPLSQSEPNFMWSLLEKRGHKVIKTNIGHMTKIPAMPIYSKILF